MKIEEVSYNDLQGILDSLRRMEVKCQNLPREVIMDTFSIWQNTRMNGVSASMLDTGGNPDHHLMKIFDLCYRYGRYEQGGKNA